MMEDQGNRQVVSLSSCISNTGNLGNVAIVIVVFFSVINGVVILILRFFSAG